MAYLKMSNLPACVKIIEEHADIIRLYKDSALFFAARYGHQSIVKLLLDKGADINHNGYNPALMVAADNGHKDVVEYLLSRGAQVNVRGRNGYTALHKAAFGAHHEIVKILIDHGADKELVNDAGQTALLKCVLQDDEDDCQELDKTAEALLFYGKQMEGFNLTQTLRWAISHDKMRTATAILTNIKFRTEAVNAFFPGLGMTPLMLASMGGRTELVKILLNMGADARMRGADSVSALGLAISGDLHETVEALLDHGLDATEEVIKDDLVGCIQRPLAYATCVNTPKVAELLVKRGASLKVKKGGRTMMMWAAAKGYVDVVRALLDRGEDVHAVSSKGETVLKKAAKSGNMELIKMLVEDHRADVNRGSPLKSAVKDGRIDAIKYLLAKGAKINSQRPSNGDTALIIAVKSKVDAGVVELLVDNGATLDHANKKQETAFLIASKNVSTYPLCLALMKKGANVNAQDSKGKSALMFIMDKFEFNLKEKVKMFLALVKGGIDVNLKEVDGVPVMGMAIQKKMKSNKTVDLIRWLEKQGAHVNFTTANGQTPLMLAIKAHKLDVVEYLITKGLDIYQEDAEGDSALIYAALEGYWELAQKWIREDAPGKQVKRCLAMSARMHTMETKEKRSKKSLEDDDEALFKSLLMYPEEYERSMLYGSDGDSGDDDFNGQFRRCYGKVKGGRNKHCYNRDR